MDRATLLKELQRIVSVREPRFAALEKIAALIKESGNHRWVGLYDIDHAAGLVSNIVWSGPGAPEFPTFPITKGLTGSAISSRKTVNVGNVANDPRYLTAFGTTQSEIIVPIFDAARENVVGTINVESEQPNAFDPHTQGLLEECAELLTPLWRLWRASH
ncbi:MAG TPA: GAF domain-containing protein [Candidatus Acidoferrum sp.]|jgi:GAF domain-containing protein